MTLTELLRDGPPIGPRQLAELVGVSTRQVRKWLEAGVCPCVRLPSPGRGGAKYGRLRVSREDARLLCETIGLLPKKGTLGTKGPMSETPLTRPAPDAQAVRVT